MQKKYKIIHLITRLDKGGSAENTLLTALGINKKKYEVILVKGPTYESRMSKEEHASVIADLKEAQLKGVKIVNIPFLLRRINPVYDLLALFSLYILLIKERPTIVHTHTSKAGLLGTLAAKMAGIPILIHTPHGHVLWGYFGPLKTKIFIFLERLTSRITGKIVALTNREKEDYLMFRIANEDRFVVIFSGVKLNKFKESLFGEKQNFKKELGIPENSSIVGTVGRLVPVKGPESLIKAAKYIISKYPDTFFIFTGDGYLRQDLENKAFKMGTKENIIFLGWRDDAAKIISAYDVFVLPSLNEGMGRVLVEAMALGKPIVASNIGGIPDLVIHGKNGFLVPPKNPKELAKYIQILLEDEKKREKMGLAGKEMSLNFSAENMVEKIAELYEELLIQKNISF
ncbi:MAG: glycosyltransferase family 1 protein [Candidatus Stahlbacteria bacterium]|nr:MAG: glycosyltransferase family 1 protein [Candidatus Stahlbacteria bacterium]